MKHHTKIYMDFFGFKIPEDAICEIPGCGLPCMDINHIDARGMGGNPKGDKDDITNLMGMCRGHHLKHGDVKADKEWLTKVHIDYIKAQGKSKVIAVITDSIRVFKNWTAVHGAAYNEYVLIDHAEKARGMQFHDFIQLYDSLPSRRFLEIMDEIKIRIKP